MTRLAFCGLGRMGAPMARRLLEAGHKVTVWNRTEEKADPLVAAGAKAAATPAEAATGAEAAITMLAGPDAVEAVVAGDDGLAAGLPDAAVVIEMSTIGPDALRALRERLPQRLDLLDAPVLGSTPQAEEGSLQIFVGGSEDHFARWGRLLEAMGSPRHVGPFGSGAAMKIVVNSTLGTLQSAVGEALALADAFGLDERATLDVLEGSAIGATVRSKRDKIASGSYPASFTLALAEKDLRLVAEAAAAHGAELRVSPAVRTWYREALEAGLGGLDYSAVIGRIRDREARG